MTMVVLLLTSCDSKPPEDITLADLTAGEKLYITRLVTLERAKAVALVDRDTGNVLLDSLAIAWGDSARVETASGIPSLPQRAELVGRLLHRILVAEEDSLLHAPRPDRLHAPIVDPPEDTPSEASAQEKGIH